MPKKRTRAAARPRLDPLEREALRVNLAFGEACKAARERRGLTYRAGAELLEVSLSQLQKLEAGAGAVGLPIAWRAARRLGVSIDKTLRETL